MIAWFIIHYFATSLIILGLVRPWRGGMICSEISEINQEKN